MRTVNVGGRIKKCKPFIESSSSSRFRCLVFLDRDREKMVLLMLLRRLRSEAVAI